MKTFIFLSLLISSLSWGRSPATLIGDGYFQSYLEQGAASFDRLPKQARLEFAANIEKNFVSWVKDAKIFPTEVLQRDLERVKFSDKGFAHYVKTWLRMYRPEELFPQLLVIGERNEYYSIFVHQLFIQDFAQNRLDRINELKKRKLLAPEDAARLAFSKQDYNAAEKIYNQSTDKSSYYYSSRLDLGWTYLHLGKWQNLRGISEHINAVIPAERRLEGRVLSAISAIQVCDYQKVKDELALFQKESSKLAQAIESAKVSDAIAPIDSYRLLALRNSLNGVLPSARMKHPLQGPFAKARSQSWIGYKKLLSEAVLKMRFVRLELLAQLYQMERGKNIELKLANQVTDQSRENLLSFPYTKDYWADEVFQLKATQGNLCKQVVKIAEKQNAN